MALISMAVHDTVDNKRTDYTRQSLLSLVNTVDFTRHRLVIVDNGSCQATHNLYESLRDKLPFTLICNYKNIGTARAVNKGWLLRKEDENAVKMDNDIVHNTKGWLDLLEHCLAKDDKMAAIGVKRKDIWEHPSHENLWFRSSLGMLPHVAGEKWFIVEAAPHIIGSCIAYSSKFLKIFGYLYQPGLYGFDDALSSIRVKAAGYYNAFLPELDVDHIDTGGTEYCDWKTKHSGDNMKVYETLANAYLSGEKAIYHGADDE